MIDFIKDIEPTIRRIEQILGLSIKVFLATSLIVIVFGIYVANLIYGNNSLMVVKKLEREREALQNDIVILKKENAVLHKRYLEWKDVNQ